MGAEWFRIPGTVDPKADTLRGRNRVDTASRLAIGPAAGESVCAVVVPAESADISLAGLAASLASAGLRRQATPERLEIVDRLPRNSAGKVLKRELQQRFAP